MRRPAIPTQVRRGSIGNRPFWIAIATLVAFPRATAAEQLPGFQVSPWFDEQVCEQRFESDVRVFFNAPAIDRFDAQLPTELIIYALPNGSSIEQTLGCRSREGLDWRFDIQHIAAQTRKLREMRPERNVVLVCAEAGGRSWTAWRTQHVNYHQLIFNIVETIKARVPGRPVEVVLSAHSGGGRFILGYLDAADKLSSDVQRVVFLDANYSYSDESRHGTKLLRWLREEDSRQLVVMAYDDREITLNGKRVVGPTGGTYRATHRMLDRFQLDLKILTTTEAGFDVYQGLNGRVQWLIHPNPKNEILHTAMVGEMNGYLYALTVGTAQQSDWGTFGGPRAYTDWIQPAPLHDAQVDNGAGISPAPTSIAMRIPPRPPAAVGGTEFMKTLNFLDPTSREVAIVAAITSGNLPQYLRAMQTVRVSADSADGAKHTVAYQVMPDYLSVGHNDDFVRIPMTPQSAQLIADQFGCTLPTCKMVDQIYQQAQVQLAPHPLTANRQAPATFTKHNTIIRQQRAASPPEKRSLSQLVAGIKKDLVISNRLTDRPRRVALFGWHRPGGQPIQPLSIVHVDTYVDYSHGVRLVHRELMIDDEVTSIDLVLQDENLSALLSDEGVILRPRY